VATGSTSSRLPSAFGRYQATRVVRPGTTTTSGVETGVTAAGVAAAGVACAATSPARAEPPTASAPTRAASESQNAVMPIGRMGKSSYLVGSTAHLTLHQRPPTVKDEFLSFRVSEGDTGETE